MNRKSAWTAGWFLFAMSAASTIIYFLTESLAPRARLFSNHYFIIAMQVCVFLVPTLVWIIFKDRKKQPLTVRLGGISGTGFCFVLCASLAVAILSLLINIAVSMFIGDFSGVIAPEFLNRSANPIIALLALVIVPPVVEELFFRGAVFGVYEKFGTGIGIFLSALAFAMLHGHFQNFFGPFIAGLLFAYIAYVFNSIWPAIFAHLINNSFVFLLGLYASSENPSNFWTYFLAAMLIALIALCYLATRFLEKLIRKDKIRRFNPRQTGFAETLMSTLFAPGFLLLFAIFLFRIYLSVSY